MRTFCIIYSLLSSRDSFPKHSLSQTTLHLYTTRNTAALFITQKICGNQFKRSDSSCQGIPSSKHNFNASSRHFTRSRLIEWSNYRIIILVFLCRAPLPFLIGLLLSFLFFTSSGTSAFMGVSYARDISDISTPSTSTFIRNKNLLDYVCGTITTMFYDPTGGSRYHFEFILMLRRNPFNTFRVEECLIMIGLFIERKDLWYVILRFE